MYRSYLVLTVLFLLPATGCTGIDTPSAKKAQAAQTQESLADLYRETLFNPDEALFESWTLAPIRGEGRWRLQQDRAAGEHASEETTLVIRGQARDSASAIVLPASFDPLECPVVEWRWMAETVQEDAELTDKARDDVAAAIMIMFGDPGTLSSPKPVPTLRYVWTGGAHARDDVIPNPYLPEYVQNIVLRGPNAVTGRWRQERRNLVEDYRAAFGEDPADFVWAVALFIDNDQTGEPAAARYDDGAFYCV